MIDHLTIGEQPVHLTGRGRMRYHSVPFSVFCCGVLYVGHEYCTVHTVRFYHLEHARQHAQFMFLRHDDPYDGSRSFLSFISELKLHSPCSSIQVLALDCPRGKLMDMVYFCRACAYSPGSRRPIFTVLSAELISKHSRETVKPNPAALSADFGRIE